jgi:putative redox protein
MASSTVTWTGEKTQFDVLGVRSGHHALADSAEPLGGGAGLKPTEMLLGALGACAGVNAVLLLKKMRQPLQSLEIRVHGDQEEEWPQRFTAIQIEFVLGWSGETDDALVEKALDLACHRYCPVHATLESGVPVSHTRRDA